MRGRVVAVAVVALAAAGCAGGPDGGPAGTGAPATQETVSPIPATEPVTPTAAEPTTSPAPPTAPTAPPSSAPPEPTAPSSTPADLTWQPVTIPPEDLPLLDAVATADGWLATSSSGDLYASASGDEWIRVETPFEVTSLTRDGDEVLAVGGPAGLVLRHDGQAWQATPDLAVTFGDFDFVGLNRIVVGPAGAVGTTQLVGVVHATDRRTFVGSSPPFPFGRGAAPAPEDLEGCGDQQPRFSSLPGLLATSDGFVALVARDPDHVNLAPVCDPVPFWSAAGETWERVGAGVPLGDGAVVHDVATGDGQHVAAGEHDGRARTWWSWDGRSWEVADTPSREGAVVAVAAGPSDWLAVASERDEVAVWHSSDGITWTTAPAPPGLDRVDDGRVLVAVGPDQRLLQVGNNLWIGSPAT